MSDDVSFLSKLVRDSMELQAQEALKDIGDQEVDTMKPLQVPKICKNNLKLMKIALVQPSFLLNEMMHNSPTYLRKKKFIAFSFLI